MTGSVTRFRRAHPCPICGGGDDMPRGKGQRCSGYLSSDERFAYCTREEHAGQAPLEDTDPASYRHILEGECRCGTTHAPARPSSDGIVATYDYVDQDGELRFQVVRKLKNGHKAFLQRRPDGNGDWIWDMQGVTRVLYRADALYAKIELGEADTVYIVEGEKDVHSAERAGAVATTNPGGNAKGNWKPEYSAQLRGFKRAVIVADLDDGGPEHARRVAASLAGVIPTIELVQAATGKDLTDHLAAGHTLDELEPIAANEAEIGAAALGEHASQNGHAADPRQLEARPLAGVEMRSIEWLEKPHWQRSAFELLAGPKGSCKGTYLAGLASRITRSGANALFVSTEDSTAIDLKPRLVAAGADISRCFDIPLHVQLPGDVFALQNLANALGGVGLLVIDPVANHIGDRDSNSDAQVRDAIAPLNWLADRLACLIIGVRHPGKSRERGALASILGSTAWVDTPRAVVMIAPDDEDPALRHIQVVAGNRSLNGSAQAFRIDAVDVPGLTEPITVAIDLGPSAKSVDDLIAIRRADSKTSRSDQARELILDVLENEGEQESDALDARIASETGLEAKTIKNLRSELRKAGLIKAAPVKDEFGNVGHWIAFRTNAPRPDSGPSRARAGTLGNPGSLSTKPFSEGGSRDLDTPDPEIPTPPRARDLGPQTGLFDDPERIPLDLLEPEILAPREP